MADLPWLLRKKPVKDFKSLLCRLKIKKVYAVTQHNHAASTNRKHGLSKVKKDGKYKLLQRRKNAQ